MPAGRLIYHIFNIAHCVTMQKTVKIQSFLKEKGVLAFIDVGIVILMRKLTREESVWGYIFIAKKS